MLSLLTRIKFTQPPSALRFLYKASSLGLFRGGSGATTSYVPPRSASQFKLSLVPILRSLLPILGESVIVRYAYLAWLRARLHRFTRAAAQAREIQHETLLAKIARNAESAFGRDHGFANIRTVADFRAACRSSRTRTISRTSPEC